MSLAQATTLACGVYVVLLLALGGFSRRAKADNSLADHFLAGRSIGFLVLLLTLFATQYSGNSLSGFPGKTYRAGLSYAMSVTFMVAILSGYLLFAPALLSRPKRPSYLTPNDFLLDRFGSRTLHYMAVAIFVFTLTNFLLAQLMAMGHAAAGLTDGRIPYAGGVIGGAAVILIYELLGGMRAVAWTDVIQGLILLAGLVLVVAMIVVTIGSPAAIIGQVAERAPAKVANPTLTACLTWLSNCVLLGLGAPLYPQAIQRLYAARRLSELKRALAVMAFLPLLAITAVVFIGITGLALFPELDAVGSDQVTFRVLGYLAETEPWAMPLILLTMMAVLAAIMSTADSALLSVASILTKDVAARWVRGGSEGSIERSTSAPQSPSGDPGTSAIGRSEGLEVPPPLRPHKDDRMVRLVPAISLSVLAVLAFLALEPRLTLWRLLEIKFEMLIQLSPAFVLGTLGRPRSGRPYSATDILRGLWVGIAVAIGLALLGHRSVQGVHAGTLGVVLNYLTVVSSRRLDRRQGSIETGGLPEPAQ